MANFITTSQGDTVDMTGCKMSVAGNILAILRGSVVIARYTYPDNASAQADADIINQIIGSVAIGSPVMTSLSPDVIAHASLPQTITINGSNFDSTAVITLVVYGQTSVALVTTFVSASQLTAIVPNTVIVSVYDVLYTDSNGASNVLQNGLVID